MYQWTCLVFLIVNILLNKTINGFQSFYAGRLDEYPKTSCLKIPNIERAGRCRGHAEPKRTESSWSAMKNLRKPDITGADINGPKWKSYVPYTCKHFIYLTEVFISKYPEKSKTFNI